MPLDEHGRWTPGTEVRERWTYDITYVLAPDGENARTKRVTVVDPAPEPGFGPALGTIHQQLRRSDPDEFGHIQDPGELVIVRLEEVDEPAG